MSDIDTLASRIIEAHNDAMTALAECDAVHEREAMSELRAKFAELRDGNGGGLKQRTDACPRFPRPEGGHSMTFAWVCPKCGASLGPMMTWCPCSPPRETVYAASTQVTCGCPLGSEGKCGFTGCPRARQTA